MDSVEQCTPESICLILSMIIHNMIRRTSTHVLYYVMLEKILSKPIEHLVITYKPLPNIEVLRLYRDVLKFTFQFYWNNEKGECWRDILRKTARK